MDSTDEVIKQFGDAQIWTLGTSGGVFIERRTGGNFAFRDEKILTWLKRVAAVSHRIPFDVVNSLLQCAAGKLDAEDPDWHPECLRLGGGFLRENVFEFGCATWNNPDLALQISEFVANVVLVSHSEGDQERYRSAAAASEAYFRKLNAYSFEDRPKAITLEMVDFLQTKQIEAGEMAQVVAATVLTKIQGAHQTALKKSLDENLNPDDTNLVPIFERALVL